MSASTESRDLNRRERKYLETHDKLYEAAVSLFAEKGYAETSVEEIAERADVARATAFNHFAKKSDYIEEWGARRRVHTESVVKAEALEERGFAALLERYLCELAESHASQRELSGRVLGGWVQSGGWLNDEPYLADMIAAHVVTAQERGEVSKDLDPEIVGHICRDIYFGVIFTWLRGPEEPFDLIARMRSSVRMFLSGVLEERSG